MTIGWGILTLRG